MLESTARLRISFPRTEIGQASQTARNQEATWLKIITRPRPNDVPKNSSRKDPTAATMAALREREANAKK